MLGNSRLLQVGRRSDAPLATQASSTRWPRLVRSVLTDGHPAQWATTDRTRVPDDRISRVRGAWRDTTARRAKCSLRATRVAQERLALATPNTRSREKKGETTCPYANPTLGRSSRLPRRCLRQTQYLRSRPLPHAQVAVEVGLQQRREQAGGVPISGLLAGAQAAARMPGVRSRRRYLPPGTQSCNGKSADDNAAATCGSSCEPCPSITGGNSCLQGWALRTQLSALIELESNYWQRSPIQAPCRHAVPVMQQFSPISPHSTHVPKPEPTQVSPLPHWRLAQQL